MMPPTYMMMMSDIGSFYPHPHPFPIARATWLATSSPGGKLPKFAGLTEFNPIE